MAWEADRSLSLISPLCLPFLLRHPVCSIPSTSTSPLQSLKTTVLVHFSAPFFLQTDDLGHDILSRDIDLMRDGVLGCSRHGSLVVLGQLTISHMLVCYSATTSVRGDTGVARKDGCATRSRHGPLGPAAQRDGSRAQMDTATRGCLRTRHWKMMDFFLIFFFGQRLRMVLCAFLSLRLYEI